VHRLIPAKPSETRARLDGRIVGIDGTPFRII
jgi:hypothetical protein